MKRSLSQSSTLSFLGMCSVMVLWSWLGPHVAQGQEATAHIHLVIVADTNDPDIGQSVASDLHKITDLFQGNVPRSHLQVTTIQEDEAIPERILTTTRKLQIQSGRDTVVLYYSGHGAFDQQSNDHVLQPSGRLLPHKKVREAIEGLQPRLAVLIADTCSIFLQRPVPAPAFPPAERISPAFKSLFLDPTGWIDISSTKPGEKARCENKGGWFTWAFANYLHDNRSSSLRWPNVLHEVNRQVRREHREARQTAYIVERTGDDNPTPSADLSGSHSQPGRLQFGITADRTAKSAQLDGVEVLRVEPNSPATSLRGSDGKKYYLVPGRDVITHVNGSGVTTNAEVVAAVKGSAAKMVVRVYDTQTGTNADYDVDLSRARQSGRIRFGVTAQQTARGRRIGGAEVTMVMPSYPGTRLRGRDGKEYYLVPGRDFITHINGQAVTTYDEFSRAIDASPSTMVIRVHDSRTRSSSDYEVTLRE